METPAASSPPAPSRPAPEDAADYSWLLALALGALVLGLKAPDSLISPQFWAEDGTIFFSEQYGHAWPRLFRTYAGYLHALPRAIAWAAQIFPARVAPALYCWVALAIGAASLASLRALRIRGLPFLLLLAGVALTPTNGEVFGTLCNIQWLLQFYQLALAARMLRAERSSHPVLRALVALCVGLTGPFVLFTLAAIGCVLALRVLLGRGAALRATWTHLRSPAAAELWVLAACACAQLVAMAVARPFGHVAETAAHPARGLLGLFTHLQTHVLGAPLLPNVLFCAVALALFGAALRVCPSSAGQRAVLGACVVFALLGMSAAAPKVRPEEIAELGSGDRYYVVIKAVFWWCVAVVASAAHTRSAVASRLVLTLLLGANAIWMASSLSRRPLRDLDWADYARHIDAGEAVVAPINPGRWKVTVAPAAHPD